MFKKENKKGECPKKNRIIHTKKEKKDREKGRTCKNIQICEDVQQKGKKLLEMQKCQIRVSKRSHRQREEEEKKETTYEQIDEQKDKKR